MTTNVRHLVLGTAGHVDHGKTALVQALTGVDTDRLAEEKRRGISIELGFAPWRLTESLEASIVDVPGHERLVRTMVAGAAGMDLGMLIVAADDGVMPQTREHLDILRLLDVPTGLLVLTKCDLVEPDDASRVETEIRTVCRGTAFEQAPLVRVSSKTRMGLDELQRAVITLAATTAVRPADGPACLPVDRVFTVAGHGTVATGTLLRGTLRVGDTLEAFGNEHAPLSGLRARGLQSLGSGREAVYAGMRAAVNLTGGEVKHVTRGMMLTHADTLCAVDACISWVEVLPRATPLGEETVTTHLGTGERETRVIPLGRREIQPGEAAGVLLRFDEPIATFAGQRLVLRRPGVHGQATVAGGVVLDPEPPSGRRSVSLAASQVEGLRGTPEARLLALARESRSQGIDGQALHRRLPPGEGREALRTLAQRGDLVRVPGARERWVDREVCSQLVDRVIALVEAHHHDAPLSPGLAEAEISSQLPPPERPLANLAVAMGLAGGKILRQGALLSLAGRATVRNEADTRDLDAICAVYREAHLLPPIDAEMAVRLRLPPKRLHELLAILTQEGALVRISQDFHFDAGDVAVLEKRLVETLAQQGDLTASQFKSIAGGVSRKYAIPLLEYFDRRRVTLRAGDVRRLHPSRRKA
ncbi:MAG: selenocysteine-specific translation elongation factor [Myxococcota bacterium]